MKHRTKTAKPTLSCQPQILHRTISQVLKPHSGRWAGGVLVVSLLGLSPPAAALDLADLNGTNGIVIKGIDAWDNSGRSVSNAGDINGDGIDDLIIGAPWASPNGNVYAGESYVVFGDSEGFAPVLTLPRSRQQRLCHQRHQ